LCYYKKETT